MIVSAVNPVDLPVVPEFYTPFELELDVRYLDGETWLLLKKFTYASVILERVIEIPEGYITDFGSIPKVFWSVLPPTGKYGKACVVHDYLCDNPQICKRSVADKVFVEAMKELGVGWWTRSIMYAGVRIGAVT